MPFNLTYRDYLANNSAGSEAGGLLSPEQWAQLDPQQQSGLVNFQGLGTAIGRNDSRYADLAQQTGVEPGRPINIGSGILDPNMRDQKGNLIVKDPSKVYQGDGYYALGADNYTPGFQAGVADSGLFHGDKWDVAKVAAFLGLGAAAGGAFGAGAGESAAGAGALNESAGLNMGNAFAGGEAAGGGAAATTGATTGAATPTSSLLGGYGDAGMIAPGMENTAALDSSLINHGLSSLAGGDLTGLLAPGGVGTAAGHLGEWALTHPLQAYGAGQTVAGLLGGHGNSGGSGSSGGSNKGGSGTGVDGGFKAQRPTYTPNPFLIQQLRQAGYSI